MPSEDDTWRELHRRASACTRCPLYAGATQTVFGEGPVHARLMLIGEQPGDQEDRQGRPFVGPAGRLLDRALAEAEIDRDLIYLTNAVKHFKWVAVDRRRQHAKPTRREAAACRPWLEAELRLVAPDAVLALGATAAQSLLGPSFRITRSRGRIMTAPWAPLFAATRHPSAILRAPPPDRERFYHELVEDMRNLWARLPPGRAFQPAGDGSLNLQPPKTMNKTTLKGNWHVAKGKLKQKYANLTDEDLVYVEGKEEELLGRIQQRTGAAEDEVKRYLKEDCGCEW